jgi:hypothetical protein
MYPTEDHVLTKYSLEDLIADEEHYPMAVTFRPDAEYEQFALERCSAEEEKAYQSSNSSNIPIPKYSEAYWDVLDPNCLSRDDVIRRVKPTNTARLEDRTTEPPKLKTPEQQIGNAG